MSRVSDLHIEAGGAGFCRFPAQVWRGRNVLRARLEPSAPMRAWRAQRSVTFRRDNPQLGLLGCRSPSPTPGVMRCTKGFFNAPILNTVNSVPHKINHFIVTD